MPINRMAALLSERAAAVTEAESLIEAAEAESRDLTDAEQTEFDGLQAQIVGFNNRIERMKATRSQRDQFEGINLNDRERERESVITGGGLAAESDPKRGFSSMGDFAMAVKAAKRNPSAIDERLMIGAAPTTYANEGSGADGGFLIPPGFSASIMTDTLNPQSLVPKTNDMPVTGNSMAFPADETEDHSTSGVQVLWESEAGVATQSKPVLKLKELRLHKAIGIVPVTDEMASDAAVIGAYIRNKFPGKLRNKFNDALIHGSGAGAPVGVVGHGGTVSVAKETSQTAATINIENLVKMFSRSINPFQSEWIANIDCFPQLFDMKDNAGARVYQTSVAGMPDGLSGLLLGRPITFVEECSTLGTVGDIVFGNWGEYVTISKGGMQIDESMHLWFDYAVNAVRIIARIDGKPWRDSTYSPAKGSNTRGNFVTLATRA